MSLCNFGFLLPSFSILDFVPIPGIPSLPGLPSFSLGAPVCLLDEF